MILVPEELYKKLLAKNTYVDSENKDELIKFSEDLPLVHTKKEIDKIKNSKDLNADEKHIRYIQEFKKFNKLLKDRNNRSLKISVQKSETTPENNVFMNSFSNIKQFPKKSKIRKPSIYYSADENTTEEEEDGEEEEKHEDKELMNKKIPILSKHENIIDYIKKYSKHLLLNEDLQVLNTQKNLMPIKRSNAHDILNYHFLNSPSKMYRDKPPGYRTLMKRIEKDETLQQMLLEGRGKSFKKENKIKKFKPKLW